MIPTVLTTTASIAAIVSLQLYTTFQTNDINYFRECFFNLNSNYFYFAPPHEAMKTLDKSPDALNSPFKAVPEGWTSWDKIEVKGSKTCGELCDYLKEKYQIVVDTILIDKMIVYDTFLEAKKNKDMKIEDVYAKYSEKPIPDKKKYFSLSIVAIVPETKINGKDYKNVNVLSPLIKYMFRDN